MSKCSLWSLYKCHIIGITGVTTKLCSSHHFALLAHALQAGCGDFELNQFPPLLRVCPCFSALASGASGQKTPAPLGLKPGSHTSETVASHI